MWCKSDDVNTPKLNVLLTNGRFPTALDLARQLHLAGQRVYVVDPMKYHVCKFSTAVRKSFHVPAPHVDPPGYIQGVKTAILEERIDLVIPLHEEIFYLADCDDSIIKDRLFAPSLEILVRLHNKWEFSRWLSRVGLDTPQAVLCCNMNDVNKLDPSKEYALKPVFGRASSKVHHVKPHEARPQDCDVDEENHYIAQEWKYGKRYCSYSIVQHGRMTALAIYPVEETIDGSSCVYFKAMDHPRIEEYITRLVENLGPISGQLAFDFIETDDDDRLVVIECNPRATSGLHLFSRSPDLARVLVGTNRSGPSLAARPGIRRQVAAGMLMAPSGTHSTVKQYLKHMGRLMATRDVMFNARDIGPTLMQPFLLTSYYEICRERGGMKLPEMFQWDVTWEPRGDDLSRIRKIMDQSDWESGSSQHKLQ